MSPARLHRERHAATATSADPQRVASTSEGGQTDIAPPAKPFPITFGGRQLWANFAIDRIQAELNAMLESDDPEFEHVKALPFPQQWQRAAERAVEIEEVANCTFRTLYYQRDPNLEEGAYFLRVDFPSDRASVKATFSGAACAGSGDFMKRLASVAPGALWTGNQFQIVRLMQRQWANIQVAEGIDRLQFPDRGDWGWPQRRYRDLWQSLHDKEGQRWEDNPEVLVLTFRVARGNIDHGAA